MATEKGYLTSSAELSAILSDYNNNIEPAYTNVTDFLGHASAAATWTFGTIDVADTMYQVANSDGIATRNSVSPARDNFVHFDSGGYMVYQKALMYHLAASGNDAYADKVISLIDELVILTDMGGNLTEGQSYNGGSQWILHAATGLPLWIQAADLIAGYSGWTTAKYQAFQTWLATEIYKFASWASHNRKNNWGSASSLLCWMIADYVDDTYITTLTETVLTGGNAVGSQYTQSPTAAKATHITNQLNRLGTANTSAVKMDAAAATWGIQSYGGIPDEVRRGAIAYNATSVYNGASVDTTSLSYQCKQIAHLIFHAECLKRRGDLSLYNYSETGVASLKLAVRFVVYNPTDSSKSADWDADSEGNLYVSYSNYKDPYMHYKASKYTGTKSGGELPYGRLTHYSEITSNAPTVGIVSNAINVTEG